MSTIQPTDYLLVSKNSTDYRITAADFRTNGETYDWLYVLRNGTDYKTSQANRFSSILTSDQFFIRRGSTNYRVDGTGYLSFMGGPYFETQLSTSGVPAEFGWKVDVGSSKAIVGCKSGSNAYMYSLNGTGQIQLSGSPGSGVAIDSTYAYSADYINRIVRVYNMSGSFVTSITATDAGFGYSMSAANNRLVVAAPSRNGAAGAVLLYNTTSSSFNFIANIPRPTSGFVTLSRDFGTGVSISPNRDIIAVGAPNGAPSNSFKGRLMLMDLNGSNIVTHNSPGANNNMFGWSVGAADGYIVVGDPSNQNDQTGGRAYLYSHSGTGSITLVATLNSSVATYAFGQSVSIGGGKVVVTGGDPNRDVPGNTTGLTASGLVEVFDYSGNRLTTISSVRFSPYSAVSSSGKILIGQMQNSTAWFYG